MHNGERERIVSQNGVVVRDTQLLRQKQYMCYDGFRQGVWLRTTTEDVVDTTQATAPNAPNTPTAQPSSSAPHTTPTTTYNSANSGWWSLHQPPLASPTTPATPPRHYTDGIYHNTRQHRIYTWDKYTSLHLYTTDGKHYRVVVEHRRGRGDVDKTGEQQRDREDTEKGFRRLVGGLAYHFSQYVRRQRGV